MGMIECPIYLGKDDDGIPWTILSENIAILAKSRSGKSTTLAAQQCFRFEKSMVVLDVKGQLAKWTAGHRATRLKQDVFIFNPAARDGRTHCWNPLATVDRESNARIGQISKIAFQLFPEAAASGTQPTNADKFWEPAGRMAYTSVSTMIAETPELPLNHANVLRMFTRGDGTDVLVRMIKARRAKGRHVRQYSQAAIDGISDYLSGHLEQVEGIRKSVSTRLGVWQDPYISAITSKSDFNLADLRRKPMTIYVTVSPADIARVRPLLSLFFETLINANVDVTPEDDDTIKHQALILLDEFAQLGRMGTVANAAAFSAGYGLLLAYIVQNRKQIETLYGPSAAGDIFDNTGIEAFFGTNDWQMAKEVSERFGDTTEMATTEQRPKFGAAFQLAKQTLATHVHRRPFMLAQEVARLPKDKHIILRSGMMPKVLNREAWFNDPDLKNLVLPMPETPLIPWDIAEDDGKTRIVRNVARNISGITEKDMDEEAA